MEVGDEVTVINLNDNSLASKYIGMVGEIIEELPDGGIYGELKYEVEFDDDTELFKEDELSFYNPKGFVKLEINLPDDLLDMLEVWSEETGLNEETLIRYVLVDYIIEDADLV